MPLLDLAGVAGMALMRLRGQKGLVKPCEKQLCGGGSASGSTSNVEACICDSLENNNLDDQRPKPCGNEVTMGSRPGYSRNQ